jgi:hypothetical protein
VETTTLDQITDIVRAMRLEAVTENRKGVIDGFVQQIIRLYENIRTVIISPESRDQTGGFGPRPKT